MNGLNKFFEKVRQDSNGSGPPELVVVTYHGHPIQRGNDVYLVPGNVGMPDEADMCTFEILSLNNLLNLNS